MSAGNGPAMRAALIGVYFADDLERLIEFCDRSSVITHRDPRAVVGARVVAIAARCAVLELDDETFFREAISVCRVGSVAVDAWINALRWIKSSSEVQLSVDDFAASIGGTDCVSGFVMESVPVAVYGWLAGRLGLRAALESVIRLGGDTDTIGAIVGGLCGASGAAIPSDLVEGLWEWPRGVKWMRLLAARFASDGEPLRFAWPLVWPRNALFAGVVLYHGFKRLL
jgi:ADP-ribosyl-[dinitrogen reductase] hydrolase